jgi:hypothetical protein
VPVIQVSLPSKHHVYIEPILNTAGNNRRRRPGTVRLIEGSSLAVKSILLPWKEISILKGGDETIKMN